MTANAEISTTRSAQLFQQAKEIIPGGVNSPVRAFDGVGGTPRFVARGEGPYLWDVDGNRYVDYVMSWGPLIHGHAFPPVIEAIQRTAALGTSFGAPSELEVELAGLVIAAMPSIQMVRFVNSGTEAAMSAIRLARGWKNKDLIVKFAGNYHGHADGLLAHAGSGSLTLGVPSSPGVPAGTAATTMVSPYNDVKALEQLFNTWGQDIAAVVVEPVAGNMGVVPPAPGFLELIQRLTRYTGALFICDEVITGFRVSGGGAQHMFGLTPDLTILGKIIGGGLPVGAYGGRRDIMECISPAGPVYQAGTLSGNPLAMAAGIASLQPLGDPDFYRDLSDATQYLAAGLRDAAGSVGIPICVNAVTGMLTLFFTSAKVATLSQAEEASKWTYAAFFHGMLNRGFYLPPSKFEAWMLSAAHTQELLDTTIKSAKDTFQELL